MMKRIAMASLLLLLVLVCGSCQKKAAGLNLLVWEGYADP